MARGTDFFDEEFCAEHNGSIASFERLTIKLDTLDSWEGVFKRASINAPKLVKIAAMAVGGAVILGPVVLAAAPAIGGAVGASFLLGEGGAALYGAAATNAGLAWFGGGSIAAGGLGVAGGVGVISGIGSALGGTLGGLVANSYFGEVKGFKIQKLQSGRGPAVVFVNGFLTEKKEGVGDWEDGLRELFPHNPWYQVHWESQRLLDIGKYIMGSGGMYALVNSLKAAARQASRKRTRKLSPVSWLHELYALSTNPWHTAMFRAAQTGTILADILARVRRGRFILLGHSLGARVLFNTLCALGTRLPSCIQSAHLLGGAIGREDRDAWSVACRAVSDRIYNYYSENDMVLRYFYKVGTFFTSDPVGRAPIQLRGHTLRNVNVSAVVDYHGDFKQKLSEVLACAAINR